MATKIILATIGAVLCKVIFTMTYCWINCINIISGTAFFFIALISIDLVLIVQFFVFYSIYCRVDKILELVVDCEISLSSCQFCYKSFLKSAEKAVVTFRKVFLVSLLFKTFNSMLSLYYTIKKLQLSGKNQDQMNVFGYWLGVFETIHSLILLFAPTIAAGLLSSKGDMLKSVLYDRMIDEKDIHESQKMEKLARYIEARPLKFTIWKILKIDWSFPVVILNVIITYLIVILQFNPPIY